MAADFAAELKKNREEKLNANKKKEKKEKKKGNVWLLELRSLTRLKSRGDFILCVLGWLKVWLNPNLVFLAGEMCPFPPQMITLKSGDDQIKFTHDRHPTPFPIVKHRAGIRPEFFLCIFYGI